MLQLRPAELRDWARLFSWRNDPATVAASPGKAPDLKTHMEWLRKVLDSRSVRLYVAHDPQRSWSVGTGRIDLANGRAELSLTVDPHRRGQDYAAALIEALVVEVEREAGETVPLDRLRIVAKVRPDNHASLRAFAGCRFLPVKYGDLVELEYRP